MPTEGQDQSAGGDVPDLGITGLSSLPPSGGQPPAIAAEGHAIYDARIGADVLYVRIKALIQGRAVPDADGPILACGGEAPAARIEKYASDKIFMSSKREQFLARFCIPDTHRLVGAGGGEAPAVGAERHANDALRLAAESVGDLPGQCIINGYGPIPMPSSHGQAPTVGTKRHRPRGGGRPVAST